MSKVCSTFVQRLTLSLVNISSLCKSNLRGLACRTRATVAGKATDFRKTKGRKVAAKYRSKKDPKLTWAGRGATPIWMREEMKGTKLKKENFLIK